MSYIIHRDGKRIERYMEGRVRLAEILNSKEYEGVKNGNLVATTKMGALLDLSSPLSSGQEIFVRTIESNN